MTEKMSIAELREQWSEITKMDSTVRVKKDALEALQKKQVLTEPFGREKMFSAMAKRHVGIYKGLPVTANKIRGLDQKASLIRTLSSKFPRDETSHVTVGPSRVATKLPVREIMRRWLGRRAIVGVTDLHIRGCKVEEAIDTQALSDFNLLIRGTEDLSLQEMMTLVIASPGAVTDSHSDDPDGTNHCFFGKKLWLAWETFEGIKAGMQDVERQDVYTRAKFDMNKFLKLKSSRWFLVSDGDTLFLPANMTHKVFTLDYYLGIGSFHVGLPGSLDNLTRWLCHGPLWSVDDPEGECDDLVDEIARISLRVAKRAKNASPRSQLRWGYNHLAEGLAYWEKNTPARMKKKAAKNPHFREYLALARSAAAEATG